MNNIVEIRKVTVGVFLKDLRIRAGLSQLELSLKMGYSTPQFISNWERGVSEPPCKSIKKLSQVLSYDESDLRRVLANFLIQKKTAQIKRQFEISS